MSRRASVPRAFKLVAVPFPLDLLRRVDRYAKQRGDSDLAPNRAGTIRALVKEALDRIGAP